MAEGVSDNVAMLMRGVERIAPLRDRLLFLGGAVTAAPPDLRAAITAQFRELLARPDAEDVVAAQLFLDAESQDRLPLVLERIESLAHLA